MFIDVAKVLVAAGDGGRGAVSFRHEKFVDRGGPDGGDGGRGGNVIFVADPNLNTLMDFRYKPELRAKKGGDGAKQNKHGANGEDLYVKVPVGTMVKKGVVRVANFSDESSVFPGNLSPNFSSSASTSLTPHGAPEENSRKLRREKRSDEAGNVSEQTIIADLTEPGQEAIIAHGGDGGFGNAHFKSSTRQAPRVAELGEQGESFEATLELKLLADVGLVGFPNAGKSTFLSVVTSAKPEIADYAFTTLTPNLGVADIDDGSLLIADIPGLIEGASEGKGLGDAFLRHVERTSVILHLIDVLSDDVAGDYTKIRRELEKYSSDLAAKPEIIALTKIDAVDDEIVAMQSTALQNVTDSPIFAISSSAYKNTTEVLRALLSAVRAAKAPSPTVILNASEESLPVISLSEKQLDEAWTVEKVVIARSVATKLSASETPHFGEAVVSGQSSKESLDRHDDKSSRDDNPTFIIHGPKIEKFARRTDFSNPHGVNRLRDIMRKMGIMHELERQGATGESIIKINDQEFTLLES